MTLAKNGCERAGAPTSKPGVSGRVLDQIRREVEAGRNLPGGERETGGVLFGIQEPGRICILASRPLQCEHAMGPGVCSCVGVIVKENSYLDVVMVPADPKGGREHAE